MVTAQPCIAFVFSHGPTPASSTLSLHDALPISDVEAPEDRGDAPYAIDNRAREHAADTVHERERGTQRSEEHTSELQSQFHIVCRLLPEKKNIAAPDHRPTPSPTPLPASSSLNS